MRSEYFHSIAIACATTAMLATTTGPGNSAHAERQCKLITTDWQNLELCIEGKRGGLTDLDNLNSVQFVLDKCIPNSSNYVSKVSEQHGIAMSAYRGVVWTYCNKGWGGL